MAKRDNPTCSANKKNLIDGKYSVHDLIDIDELAKIFEKFTKATGFTIGFLDHPGLNVIAATGWRDICVKFHRVCPISMENCKRSNEHLLGQLKHAGQLIIESCDNGLVDCATPIIVKGRHIASLATGQLFLKKPDHKRFEEQAKAFGFDEKKYMKALKEIPVISRQEQKNITSFLGSCAIVLSEMGYTNLKVKEKTVKLKEEIAERKRTEAALQKNEAELAEYHSHLEELVQKKTKELTTTMMELNQAKRLAGVGALAATIAHRLRTPLATIRMSAFNIKNKIDNALVSQHLENMDKKIVETDQIINNLILYASHLKESAFKDTRFYDILNEAIESIKSDFSDREIKLITKFGIREDALIEADPFQLKELFSNILTNAYDALRGKNGNIEIKTENIGIDEIGITIKDNGEGIAEDVMKRLFEPFFTTKVNGLGVGLNICAEITQMHKGKITVKSKAGKGTTVLITLPLKQTK